MWNCHEDTPFIPKMKTIRILNPRPGTTQFTSERAARKYVEKKRIARWADDNKDSIFFFEVTRARDAGIDAVAQAQSAARILGKVIFWNGEDGDPSAIHIPGAVRS